MIPLDTGACMRPYLFIDCANSQTCQTQDVWYKYIEFIMIRINHVGFGEVKAGSFNASISVLVFLEILRNRRYPLYV